VVQLHRNIDVITGAGARVFVIGNGSPSFIAGFRDETKYPGPIYTDPSLRAYQAAELKRGITKTFDPRALGGTIKAFREGFRQGRTQGDNWQQGGVLVVATDGRVLWHHASDRPGDNARADEIARALRKAA